MKRRGFTLVELTVVLAVLVVLTGFLIVRVGGWTSTQSLHASARALGNTIRTYREKARLEERTYVLRIEGGDYAISEPEAAGRFEVLRRGRLAPGQALDPPDPVRVTLDARGVLPPTRIGLVNARGEKVTIVLGSVLNDVRYEEATR